MTDEIKLTAQRERASRAQRLLDDDMLKDAFRGLKDQYSGDLLSTTVDQQDARERLYLAYRVVVEVERHLTNIVNTGKLAEADLRQLEQTAARKKRFGIV